VLSQLTVAGRAFKLEKVVDVNVMARRALKDEMPGMVFRGITRAIVKGAVQEQLQKNAGLLGALVGSVASAVTEQADDRMWRMLPGRVYVARGYLPEGEHRLVINGRDVDVKVDVKGQYAMVPLRLYHNSVVPGNVGSFGALVAPPPVSTPATVEVPAATVPAAKAKTPVKKPVARTPGKPVAAQ
jgi:hypothetical protein